MSAGRRYCSNCGIALDVGGGCGVCKPEKEAGGVPYVTLRNALLSNPGTSFALTHAIQRFDVRDPVDAFNDAATLYRLCKARADAALAEVSR